VSEIEKKPDLKTPKYSLKVELNVLNHLGINLYSNIAAVVSEIVANAWDADAQNVNITISKREGTLTITDDGVGMSRADVNERYLNVGFQRREVIGNFTPGGRLPMGRKGIGKLSLFSAARVVKIYTCADGGEQQAFEMRLADIKKAIEAQSADGKPRSYNPMPIHPIDLKHAHGTTIVLSDLRRGLSHTGSALRRRIARRFGVIGPSTDFRVYVDKVEVTVADRDYFSKLQMIWYFGAESSRFAAECKAKPTSETDDRFLRHAEMRPNILPSGEKIQGWIGTVFEPRQLKDTDDDESINHLVVLSRGKLVQEDILNHVNDGGLYTKYVVGEIYEDHLDIDSADDITTSSRQQLIQGDPRYEELKKFVRSEMLYIETVWGETRRKLSLDTAFKSKAIHAWYVELPKARRKAADKILSTVGDVSVDREEDRYELYEHAILAFETLAVKDRLADLDRLDMTQLGAVAELFAQVDDIEATRYHEITRLRVNTIDRIRQLVDQSAKEKIIQQELFDHLYLLDPSWEQATDEPADIEKSFQKIFQAAKLTDNEKFGRVDIRFKRMSGLHIVIELKKPDRIVSLAELIAQVGKYRSAMEKGLAARALDEAFDIVVVLGRDVRNYDTPAGRQTVRDTLAPHKARVVRYDELIDQAYAAYGSYLNEKDKAGRVLQLVDAIRSEKDQFLKDREEARRQALTELRRQVADEDEKARSAPTSAAS